MLLPDGLQLPADLPGPLVVLVDLDRVHVLVLKQEAAGQDHAVPGDPTDSHYKYRTFYITCIVADTGTQWTKGKRKNLLFLIMSPTLSVSAFLSPMALYPTFLDIDQ